MNNNDIYITINHLDDFNGLSNIKVGDTLTLKKDLDNPYDDEAIAVYNLDDIKVGYVANSVSTVARGTYSAGRVYTLFEQLTKCFVTFITQDEIIASFITESYAYEKSMKIEFKQDFRRKEDKHNASMDSIRGIVNSFENGELTLVASRPMMGKTSFLIHLFLQTLTTNHHKALFFSLESPLEALNNRILSIKTRKRITSNTEYSKDILDEIKEIENELNALNYYINDEAALTVFDIDKTIEKIQKESEVSAVFIDYFQLIDFEPRMQQSVVKKLKEIAMRRNVPIIISSQLGRGIEYRFDKRPILKDLSEKGLKSSNFDNIIFLHRPCYDEYEYSEDDLEDLEILVAESSLGLRGLYKMVFDRETGNIFSVKTINQNNDSFDYDISIDYDPYIDYDEDALYEMMESISYNLDEIDVIKNEKYNKVAKEMIPKLMRLIE